MRATVVTGMPEGPVRARDKVHPFSLPRPAEAKIMMNAMRFSVVRAACGPCHPGTDV
jgi:hypothetical protein